MKPIETRYKGYRFRSRLEARWAAFFDAAGIEWLYEHEGFVLANGRPYLPDFYLPYLDVFIEIKPAEEHFAEAAAARLCDAFRHPTAPLIVFWGLPGESFGLCQLTDSATSGGGQSIYEASWCGFEDSEDIGLTLNDYKIEDGDRTIWRGYHLYEEPHTALNRKGGDVSNIRLTALFDVAPSARFEFGEGGAG